WSTVASTRPTHPRWRGSLAPLRSTTCAGPSPDFEPPAGAVMSSSCTHLDQIITGDPTSTGCEDCLAAGKHDWVHLRVCQACGHVGFCRHSPGASCDGPFPRGWPPDHPLVRAGRRLVLLL